MSDSDEQLSDTPDQLVLSTHHRLSPSSSSISTSSSSSSISSSPPVSAPAPSRPRKKQSKQKGADSKPSFFSLINSNDASLIPTLHSLVLSIHDFITTSPSNQMSLPPMPADLRAFLKHLLKLQYGVTVKARGHHLHKHLVIYKTNQTRSYLLSQSSHAPDASETVVTMLFDAMEKDPFWKACLKKHRDELVKVKDGSVVGHNAQPLDDRNIGYRMLLKMGWTPTDGDLGSNNEAVVKLNKHGL